ncbi:hypothetical protein AB3N60_01855 [Leptospira sp. WS39.C2]
MNRYKPKEVSVRYKIGIVMGLLSFLKRLTIHIGSERLTLMTQS